MEKLDDRKKKILQLIIEDYISTAEPVGSRNLARKYNLNLSAATIRNEMSDLELLGYLEQPHTSAGRIPSVQAYRLYVDELREKPNNLTKSDIEMIMSSFNDRQKSIDDIFKATAKILSRMTKNVSMVLADQDDTAIFRYIKFLPLDEKHAILVLVTDNGHVDNVTIDIPKGMETRELDYLANRVSELLAGHPLSDINEEILEAVHTNVAEDKVLFASLLATIRRMGRTRSKQKVFLGGTKQLLNQPEFQDVDRVRGLLGILDEEHVVRDLLNAGEDSGLRVRIGSENKFTGIQDCSMVRATYRLNGHVVGTMAVLGPTRMEYSKVISVMNYLHRYLQSIFAAENLPMLVREEE
ncbi:MAG: heat-inducible transcriptional repressor HrcA [Acidaminococcaceae bacterium]|nr:heat-inducible transcriptional repressor HrcA [Acidaminococcaceae bacterium]